MTTSEPRDLAALFDEVPELYDRVRPSYSAAVIRDLVEITGIDASSSIIEVGCGTGQATSLLAGLGCAITAVERGPALAAFARRRLAGHRNVTIVTSKFEEWDAGDAQFDVLVAASSWHWVDQPIGWRKAHAVLRPGGWLALLGHVVVRRPGEPEVYAETADLHERFVPGHPRWGHPDREEDVLATDTGWGVPQDDDGWFGPTVVRFYETVQWFDGAGFADMLRTQSLYRSLDEQVRELLLEAIAERIRTHMDDRVPRRYVGLLRAGRRLDDPPAAHR